MAKLITSLTLCSERMTFGERRTAQRLESYLNDDALIWYDIPVGRQYRHPDFVIIDPENGLIFLEVKDWYINTLQYADPQTVILNTAQGKKQERNPLEQVREYACSTAEILESDPNLQQKTGLYKGKLNIAWAYGVVFTNITREQLNSLATSKIIESIFPASLTICRDEMTESISPEHFRKKISGLFTTRFKPRITKTIRDHLRKHLFPEITIKPQKSSSINHIMDIKQEMIARNLGKGHRVIHGVAGSGKTLILLYRCLYLAEITERPILVLCFNIILANYLRECISGKKFSHKIHIHHFHEWCYNETRKHNIKINKEGIFFDDCFSALEDAVNNGLIKDPGYDAVLVDEGHDFDQRWLSLIARLFNNANSSLLLMYDDAQSIYKREKTLNFSLSSIGIQAQGRTYILRVNYRNPRHIFNFAYTFSRDYFNKHHNKEIPLLLPEVYGKDGDTPEVIQCISIEDEAFHVVAWLKNKFLITNRWGDMAILCPTQFSAERLINTLMKYNIPIAISFSSTDKKNYSHKQNAVHILTFQSSKGLEFPFVAVINASFVHRSAKHESEAVPALYVAFTRATRSLLVTYYKENSISRYLTKLSRMEIEKI